MTHPDEKIGSTELAERKKEDQLLKAGYAGILVRRHPFQSEDTASYNDEDAYALSLEREYLDIPRHLEFSELKGSIPEKHHGRMQGIWDLVERNFYEFDSLCNDLTQKWTTSAPADRLDNSSATILESSEIKIPERFRNGIRAVISDATNDRSLGTWQREDRSLRKDLFVTSKKYFTALRLYYEMLLESSSAKKEPAKEYVLAKDHPARAEIAQRNRYLRAIDALHQGIAISKTAHHGQEEGRTRKTEKIPYVVHEMDVTYAASLDVIPYTLDKGMANLAVIIALAGSIHDVIEDTDLTMEDIFGDQGYVRRLADVYDSRIDPLIKSGFEGTPDKTRDQIKKRVLNLLKDEVFESIEEILRFLSNNIDWKQEEKMTAVKQSIGGKERTMKVLGIDELTYQRWKTTKIPKQTKTFEEFPEEPDEKDHKSTAFLMRLNALHGSAESRQVALILKLEDRANNILTSEKMEPEKQRRILRSTTSRIIAWAMMDHDNKKRPLYNALPRAVDTAIMGYERLMASSPDSITDLDRKYIAKLKEWKIEIEINKLRHEVPAKVQAVLDKNRKLKAAELQQAA